MLKIKNAKKLIAILATSIVLSSFTGCSKAVTDTPDDYVEISSDDETVNELDRLGVELKEFSLTEDFNIYQVMAFDDRFKEYTTNNIINDVNPYYTYDKYIAPNEFSEYTGIKNTEWDDIRIAVEKLNTTQEYKDFIYRGINNLEASNFNTNLDLLLYNLTDLKIVEVNDTGIKRTADNPAYFNPEKKKIVVNRNIECDFEATFNHELFGHGMTNAVIYKDNKTVRCSTYPIICTFINGNYTGKELIGYSYEESLAELIATKANGKKDNTVATVYSLSMYLFTCMLEANNITLEEYASNGINILYDKIKENDMLELYGVLRYSDVHHNYLVYSQEPCEVQPIKVLFNELSIITESYAKEGKSKEELENKLYSIINSYTPYLEDVNKQLCSANYSYIEIVNIEDLENAVELLLSQYEDQKKLFKH